MYRNGVIKHEIVSLNVSQVEEVVPIRNGPSREESTSDKTGSGNTKEIISPLSRPHAERILHRNYKQLLTRGPRHAKHGCAR